MTFSSRQLLHASALLGVLFVLLCGPAVCFGQSGPERSGGDQAASVHRLVLLGPPAAGKSTLGKGLREALGVPHVNLGEMLREEGQLDTADGKRVRAIMDRGELVPDALVFALLFRRLGSPDCAGGFILDGFPRTLAQAEALDRHLQKEGRTISRALILQVSPENLTQRRLMRFRPDDGDEVSKIRHATYDKEIAPVVEFYRGRGVLRVIDGDKRPQDVLMDSLQAVFP